MPEDAFITYQSILYRLLQRLLHINFGFELDGMLVIIEIVIYRPPFNLSHQTDSKYVFSYPMKQRAMDVFEQLLSNLFTGSVNMHILASKALSLIPSTYMPLLQPLAEKIFRSLSFATLPDVNQVTMLQALTYLSSHSFFIPDGPSLRDLISSVMNIYRISFTECDIPDDPYSTHLHFILSLVCQDLLPSYTTTYPVRGDRYAEATMVLTKFLGEFLSRLPVNELSDLQNTFTTLSIYILEHANESLLKPLSVVLARLKKLGFSYTEPLRISLGALVSKMSSHSVMSCDRYNLRRLRNLLMFSDSAVDPACCRLLTEWVNSFSTSTVYPVIHDWYSYH